MPTTLGMSEDAFVEALKSMTREERIRVMVKMSRGWIGLLKSKGKQEYNRLMHKLGKKP